MHIVILESFVNTDICFEWKIVAKNTILLHLLQLKV